MGTESRKNRFDLSDFVQEQSFLEQMHRMGKRLIAKKGTHFIFDECVPEEYVYRMECINTKSEDDISLIEKYADFGWEIAEVKVQKGLFYRDTRYSWYYFCKKKSVKEAENEISSVSERLKLCAHISRRINAEFIGLIFFTALLNIVNIYAGKMNFFYEFLYIILTLCILVFTVRYLRINFGMTSKIKQLLTVYTEYE